MAKVGSGCGHHREGACSLRQNFVAPSLLASVRTINILELRQNIFHFINNDPTRKKTLLALALTCESFTGIALDLLWQNLDSFVPLLKCLPASLWKPREFKFQRAMIPDDWSIFRKYNYRVRTLDMRSFAPNILEVIGCPPFPLPLLPNLISLTWYPGTIPFSYIRLFATQELTTLNIQFHCYKVTNGLHIQSILSSISMICRSISQFNFYSGTDSSVDTSAVLQCWFQLSHVYTGQLSDAAIIHLANQPSLRVLRLELLPTSINANTQALLWQDQHCAFRALQELSLVSWSLAPLRALFKMVSFSLTSLSLTVHVGEDSAQLPDVMFHISNGCTCSALERLRIRIVPKAGYSSPLISHLVLRPLSSFCSLRKFTLYSNDDVQLDGASLLQMVIAWPLLEELTIQRRMSSRHITMDNFVALLRLCPRLSSVAISIDWSAVDRRDISSKVYCRGFVHENLCRVNFSNSRIRHATRIAAFLSAIAPKLESVSAWTSEHYAHPHFEKYSARWRDVSELVRNFSAIRRQERRAMAIAGGADGGGTSAYEEDSEEDMEMESYSDSDEVSGDEE